MTPFSLFSFSCFKGKHLQAAAVFRACPTPTHPRAYPRTVRRLAGLTEAGGADAGLDRFGQRAPIPGVEPIQRRVVESFNLGVGGLVGAGGLEVFSLVCFELCQKHLGRWEPLFLILL